MTNQVSCKTPRGDHEHNQAAAASQQAQRVETATSELSQIVPCHTPPTTREAAFVLIAVSTMPVYLCKPGCWASEPWRHGIQVYAFPFPIDSKDARTSDHAGISSDNKNVPGEPRDATSDQTDVSDTVLPSDESKVTFAQGVAIRRVRHAEVVLVDDVCVDHGRYWLRLRWPGKGGFAGYIALGVASPCMTRQATEISDTAPTTTVPVSDPPVGAEEPSHHAEEEVEEMSGGYFAQTGDDDERIPSSPKDDGSLQCLRTGLFFPSSSAMQLLALYDDGLNPTVAQPLLNGEPVFCRICREGLHDDEEKAPEESPEDDVVVDPPATTSTTETTTGPLQPHPTYHSNNYAAENPLLAPCECSGSMAFVHYLCVEQWRCRSRHPEARNGLHCETCGSAYALPPPSSRPVSQLAGIVNEEDWLEAMPPHVMAALRQPHIWWQIGAAIVRRRWLRPVAPILMSPLVALYCRARRLLKKRGVSRRRWACSLCRRRARWKCVRCLRSYYCSRQCQNVSWHIVHKHVCYKPARFWWSTVVYSLAAVAIFPGILKDPLIYDFGISMVPASFFVIGVLAGGMATVLKRCLFVDLRGRFLEFSVLLVTLWLVTITWGLVWAFFGDVSQCKGVFGPASLDSIMLTIIGRFVFQPGQKWFSMWDRLALQSPLWLRKFVCMSSEHCFAHSHLANPYFYLEEENCASDILLVGGLWMSAAIVLLVTCLLKKHERRLRARGRGRRPHED